MVSRLNPYLSFKGTACQAMEFYASVFGGNLAFSTPASCAATGTSCLRTGRSRCPCAKQIWGDEFGMCVDTFGVSWMVNISQPHVMCLSLNQRDRRPEGLDG